MQAATVVINRRALRHNLQRLRELAPASKMVAVVKANAYGHGLLETARTLPDADAFGVARLEEALRLRAGGITKPVLLLEGFFDARDLPTISAQHFHTAVHNEEQLAALEEASLDEPVTVWMKLDTGMHRLGVRPEQAEAFYHRLTQCKNVRQPVNIVSHFARADEPKCGATEKQLAIFNTFCEGKPGQRSIAASGGILLWPQSHFDWVRPGIILYGVSPLEDRSTGADFGCQPVMSLTSSLIAVREHKAGEPVGYGGTWVSERDTRLGVVAMMTNSFLLLPIIGLVFVIETSSSLIQLFSKKFFHHKVFISAPLHHHLEAKGWGEAKIVMRFWIVAGVCAIIGVFLAAAGGAI